MIENVRQLRHDVDDSCPIGPDGKQVHTYDYREGGCRQVRNAEVSANLGWAMPGYRLGDGHAARLREAGMAITAEYLGMSLQIRRSRSREPGVFPPLRGPRVPSATLRRLFAAALPADHRLPVVRQPARDLGAGGREGGGALLYGGAPRDPATVQAVHAVSGAAGRSGYTERRAFPA